MKLDYKILWIEDDQGWITSVKSEIERFIQSKGHNPIFEIPSSIDTDYIKNNSFDEYDLMLIDYTLPGLSKDSGDKLIEKIRAKKIYTNIVFYTNVTDKLQQEIQDKKLDGVYFFDRTQLEIEDLEDLFALIDFFIKKDMDNSSLRGIAMAEVAQFDKKILNILKDNNLDEKIVEKVKEQQNNCVQMCAKNDDEILSLVYSIKGTMILNSKSRKDILHSKILKNRKDVEEEYKEIKDNYENEILDIRNSLAHQIERTLNEEEKIEFGKNLIKFRKIFAKLESELCKKP